jgi:glycerate 2-kinase
LKDVVVLSAGTDGTDGPTDAAGALADGSTVARAEAQDLDAAAYLANNDSYPFFEYLGNLIKTGPTGTNVADIRIMLLR